MNPCLSTEAAWAGSGLELYLFLSYRRAVDRTERLHRQRGVQLRVRRDASTRTRRRRTPASTRTLTWWLDVESASNNWSSNTDRQRLGHKRVRSSASSKRGSSTVGIYSNRSEWTICRRAEAATRPTSPNGSPTGERTSHRSTLSSTATDYAFASRPDVARPVHGRRHHERLRRRLRLLTPRRPGARVPVPWLRCAGS